MEVRRAGAGRAGSLVLGGALLYFHQAGRPVELQPTARRGSAEHAAATQRRLALAFQTWTHVITSRARGEKPVVEHTRITDGEVISTL